jgi:hypothetical protein
MAMDDPKVVALLEEIRNNQLRQIELSKSVIDQSRDVMAQQKANLDRARKVLVGVIGLIAFLTLILIAVAAKVVLR